MKNNFAYTVTHEQRQSQLCEEESRLAQLVAQEAASDLIDPDWGEMHPAELALVSRRHADALEVTRQQAIDLACFIEMDIPGDWLGDVSGGSYSIGKEISANLEGIFGPTVYPSENRKAEVRFVRRRISNHKRKLA